MLKTDLLIIGAGAAALSSAGVAMKKGVKNVLIIEKSEELGGILNQCIHNGFGALTSNEDLTGTEYANKLINNLSCSFSVSLLLNTTALKIDFKKRIVYAVNSKFGYFEINFKATIISTGCYEEPFGSLNIEGSRPAGIMTAGTAQKFINTHGYLPGSKVVIYGTNIVGLTVARRLALEGAKVLCIIENLPYCRGPLRDLYLCQKDFDIPTYFSCNIKKIFGKNKLEKIETEALEQNTKVTKKAEIYLDTLLIALNLIPENGLLAESGVIIDEKTKGPVVDQNMQTSIPGVFACGNNVYIHDIVDIVVKEASLTGNAAANFIKNFESCADGKAKYLNLKVSKHFCYAVPQLINLAEVGNFVEIYLKPTNIFKDVNIVVESGEKTILKKLKKRINPSLMEKIVLSKSILLEKVDEEILISIKDA